MTTHTDHTLTAYVDASRVLGEATVRRAFDTLQAYASHPDDVADGIVDVVLAIAPVPSTRRDYSPVPIPVAVRTALGNVRADRSRRQGVQRPTDDTTLAEVAESELSLGDTAPRLYWEDVRDTLPDGGASLTAAIDAHLNRKEAHARLGVILASGPALKISDVADAMGMPRNVHGKRSSKALHTARVHVCGMAALAFAEMGYGRQVRYVGPETADGTVPMGPAETVEQRAERARAWVTRRKGSAPTLPGQREVFIDGRNPLAAGPDASLGYRPARLAKTGGERRDAPVKVRPSVAAGLSFGGGAEVAGPTLVYGPGDTCPTPVDVPCGCVGACDCAPVQTCGCERVRVTMVDGRGILCHRTRVLATTDAQRAKVSNRREEAAEALSAAYDDVQATFDAKTGATVRVEVPALPDSPSAAYAIVYAAATPCERTDYDVALDAGHLLFDNAVGMCRCGKRRGALVLNADGILCHRSQARH